jgi:hypothetical protein
MDMGGHLDCYIDSHDTSGKATYGNAGDNPLQTNHAKKPNS